MNQSHSYFCQLTVIIHHSGLLLAAVRREADDLHLHEGIDDLTERSHVSAPTVKIVNTHVALYV